MNINYELEMDALHLTSILGGSTVVPSRGSGVSALLGLDRLTSGGLLSDAGVTRLEPPAFSSLSFSQWHRGVMPV